MAALNDKSRLMVSASGIFVSYFIFGMLQEKITRGRYGDEENIDGSAGERFTFTLALVGVQCLFNWLFVKGKFCKSTSVSNYHHVIL
jgi:solute carrier family 35 (UDP-galactose transporter), member B1